MHPVPSYIYTYICNLSLFFTLSRCIFLVILPPLLSLYLLPPVIPAPASVFSHVVDDDDDNDDSCSLSLNLLALSSTLFTVHIYLCYIIRRVCSEQIPREHSTRSFTYVLFLTPVRPRISDPAGDKGESHAREEHPCDTCFVSDTPALFAGEREKTLPFFLAAPSPESILRPRTSLLNHPFSGPHRKSPS